MLILYQLFFFSRQKDEYSKYDPADYPFLIAFWAASVVGPVLFLLAILHAALWKWPSTATGSVVYTLMRLIFFF